jgi:hypothetical protein
VSASFEQRSQAIVDGVEAIDPEFVLHLPSSTLKRVLGHFLDGPGARPGGWSDARDVGIFLADPVILGRSFTGWLHGG